MTFASQEQTNKFQNRKRFALLSMVENDPAQIDVEFWIDYFKRTHMDAVILSAGGIVAYYPTEVPFHHRSAWLGNSDPFGELVAGAKKLGMLVIARTDPHAIRQDAYEARPDWVAVDAQDQPRRHQSRSDLWLTCTLGSFFPEFMNEIHKEIVRKYEVDGFHCNRWGGNGICYCPACRNSFRQATGMELPETADPRDPQRMAYNGWIRNRLMEIWEQADGAIRSVRPDSRFLPNMANELNILDLNVIGKSSALMNVDKQGRAGLDPPWIIGRYGKFLHSVLQGKPIIAGFNVGPEVKYRWKDSVQNGPELKLFYASALANNMRYRWGKFSATLYDRRWLKTIEEVYGWHYQNERYFENRRSMAKIALLYSPAGDKYYHGRQDNEDHALGMYQALIEARIPFDMIHEQVLDEHRLAPYQLLIMANAAHLSEEQNEQIRRFVRRGGSVLATYETSLYDEKRERRENFGLADLFGVDYKAHQPGPVKNSYLKVEADPKTGTFHPILRGLEDAYRIINGVFSLEVTEQVSFEQKPLTVIPAYPDLPMEDVYPRITGTDIAGVYLREIGESRIAYIPWDIDRLFWELLLVDHGKLLGNLIRWAAHEQSPVTVEGIGMLEVAAWRQDTSMTVHLVNMSNPMAMRGFVREFIPIPEQRVMIRLPDGKKAKRVKLLVKEAEAPYRTLEDGTLELIVPSIIDHEIVAVEW